jgi:hypothetical protein
MTQVPNTIGYGWRVEHGDVTKYCLNLVWMPCKANFHFIVKEEKSSHVQLQDLGIEKLHFLVALGVDFELAQVLLN